WLRVYWTTTSLTSRSRTPLRWSGCTRLPFRAWQRQTEPEGAAVTGPLAVGADLTAVQMHEVPRDRQAESHSTIRSGQRRITLVEAFPDPRELLVAHPDARI